MALRRMPRIRSRLSPALRAAGCIAAVWSAASCQELDTTRIAPPKATLGDDMYGTLCDRVGASSFSEDLSGASYQAICHFDASGKYGDKVDESVLSPPPSAAAKRARQLSVAKLEAMARHRTKLIKAFNAAMPSKAELDDLVKNDGSKISLHDALFDLTQQLIPLYESNPFDKAGEPLLPSQTRSLARLVGSLAAQGSCANGKACSFSEDCADKSACSMPARDALARMWGRQGYRPSDVALGAIRPALAYPKLRPFSKASLSVLGPGGAGEPALQQLFKVVKQELLTAKATVAGSPRYTVNAATLQPNRPRSTIEVVQAIMLAEDPSFGANDADPPMYIAKRDLRGFALTDLKAPFADQNADGFADVDPMGRFLDASGKPVTLSPPFQIPGVTTGDADAFGRPLDSKDHFVYLDTSRTLLAGAARHLVPLLDSTETAGGDPDAWKQEHETLMYALAGAYALYGGREDAQYDYATDTILAPGGACKTCVPYRRFRAEDSPLPDFLHALGQVLADPDSDALLASLLDLVENHTQIVARLLGAALKIQDIATAHDQKAAQGTEPKASLDYKVPIWDEMAQVVNTISVEHPGLLTKLIEALADDAILEAHGSSKHMGETVATMVQNRDELGYDPNNVNGPAVNYTVGAPSTADPKTPVDQNKPKTGKNRSCLQRSLQLIHDSAGGPACNKQGAEIPLFGAITWPLIGTYDQCELFEFKNLAAFYLDSLLDADHPKRAELKIKDGTLNDIMDFLGNFTDPNDLFQSLAGIDGLTLHPEPAALNRLVFFGADSAMYPGLLDLDPFGAKNQKNYTINHFVSSTIEPVSLASCPPVGPNQVPTCADKGGTLRVADANTIFLWERLGFTDYLRPVVTAFANTACTPDLSFCDTDNMKGELLFIEVIDILNRHWPGKDHGAECSADGSAKTNKKYCSEAGVNRYEPIMIEAFRTDIIPALHEFAKVARDLSKVTVKRGPKAGQVWTGAEVLEKMTRILFDQKYAADAKMVDRKGNKGAVWVDGTAQSQLTVFTLFADALHKIDTRWEKACDGLGGQELTDCQQMTPIRKGQWKRARSQLVDEFLAVDGSGPTAKFHNPALPATLATTLKVIREQLNANCPDREKGVSCAWAKKDLADKFATTLSGPLFAGLMDVQEELRRDETARRETERLLTYLLTPSSPDDAFAGALASFSDLLQVVADDGNLTPILQAIAVAANTASDPDGDGAADTGLKVLKAVTGDKYDRHHALDIVLPKLVTPTDGGESPIEVILDTIAEVNRIDAAASVDTVPLDDDDYRAMMGTVEDFLTSNTRGLEQFYFIVQNRPQE
ncbi:MAG: hypothetical protein U0359_41340 [Byssovorax sp.]